MSILSKEYLKVVKYLACQISSFLQWYFALVTLTIRHIILKLCPLLISIIVATLRLTSEVIVSLSDDVRVFPTQFRVLIQTTYQNVLKNGTEYLRKTIPRTAKNLSCVPIVNCLNVYFLPSVSLLMWLSKCSVVLTSIIYSPVRFNWCFIVETTLVTKIFIFGLGHKGLRNISWRNSHTVPHKLQAMPVF